MFIGFEVTLLQIIYLLESQTCGKDGWTKGTLWIVKGRL